VSIMRPTGTGAARRAALALALLCAATLAQSATARPHARQPRAVARAASYLGVPVSTRDVPWVAALTYWDPGLKPNHRYGKLGYAIQCTGAVIGPQRVLTAGHCVDDYDLRQLAVSVGVDDDAATRGHVVPIKRAWILDIDHGVRYGHDLAVVETTEPLGVPAIPIASTRPLVGEAVSSYGYGGVKKVDDDGGGDRLQRLDQTVAADCSSAGDANAICLTAPNGGGIRGGDSGGPLVIMRDGQPQLVGPASAADNQTGSLAIFGDATTQGGFITNPSDADLVPVLQQPEPRILGALKPGANVTCAATFEPAPDRVVYRWYVGSLLGPRRFYRDEHGRKVWFRARVRPTSTRRTMRIPRDAGGKPLSCSLLAYSGPYHRIALATDRATVAGRRAR
jgi:hypothetical protein